MTPKLRSALFTLLASAVVGFAACSPSADHPTVQRPPKAQKWYERALREYRTADIDAAHDSAEQALELVPDDEEVKLLAAQVALARLELDHTLTLLKGMEGSAAAGLRGRAYWYKGDLEATTRELEKVLAEPDVEDPWAKEIIKLAIEGAGARQPFEIVTTDGRLETVQMARVAGMPLYVVPIEIEGDPALGLISTASAEVMLDSTTRREPSWVSLRFGKRLEVKDVPTMPQDLSEISRKLGAPIKALIGANLLRRLHVTLDHRGRQFVARSFDPPPPPVASRVDVFYLRGGGMVLGGMLGEEGGPRISLFVDSMMGHSLALDRDGWKKAGIDVDKLPFMENGGGEKLKSSSVPLFTLGSFKLPQTMAVFSKIIPIQKVERELEINIDGTLGAGVLSEFRMTFSERGRVLWVEQRGPVPNSSEIPLPGGLQPPGLNPQVPQNVLTPGDNPDQGVFDVSPDGPGPTEPPPEG